MLARTESDGQDPQCSPSSSTASEESSCICRLWDVPPHITHHSGICYLYSGSASKKGAGGLWPLTPWWGYSSLSLQPKDGLEPWGWWKQSEPVWDGGCMGRRVLTQNALHLQNSIAHPPGCCQRPWAWFPHGLCLHKSGATLHKSMEKEKHLKQKSYPREPGQPAVLQRQERYLSLKEGWIHLSARVNSWFCS